MATEEGVFSGGRGAETSRVRSWFRANGRNLLPFAVLLAEFIFFSVMKPQFLTEQNVYNIFRQSAVLLVVALGATFIILMGSIDLSVGSVVTLSGIVASLLIRDAHMGVGAVLAAVVVGLVAGLINGVIFAKGKVPSFLVTLGTLSLFDGLALLLIGGAPVMLSDRAFKWLTSGTLVGSLPNIGLWAILIFAVVVYVATRTRFGRYIYAIGGGERVSRLSGVNVDRYKIYAYMVSGLCAGIAGALMASRIGAGTPRMGEGLLLDSIAAVTVGGTALTGGVGGPARTLAGALVIGILSTGLNVMSVDPFLQIMIKGAVVILAVLVTLDRSKIEIMK
ncbi:MAG: ABC transporter permease [Actinobacteria bacterium]|nr:ABC transporter permease [Actinomycetota bacterium]